MLSFDVEEYFQCEVYRQAIGPERWSQWPSRVEGQMDTLLALLDDAGVRATFFVLGRVVDSHPNVIRRIAEGRHEIACHGYGHEMIARLGPDGFREDTRAGKMRLEDLVAEPVLGYRAATFGLVRQTAWAIDILADLGFTYDSSVQPIRHDRYGVPGAPTRCHRAIGPGGGEVLEFPPMTGRVLGRTLPLGGGGYFRLFPVAFFHLTLKAWAARNEPAMLYLHPWELDPGQPRVPIPPLSQWRHRVNLGRTAGKLRSLLSAHAFRPVRDVVETLSPESLQSYAYAPPPSA